MLCLDDNEIRISFPSGCISWHFAFRILKVWPNRRLTPAMNITLYEKRHDFHRFNDFGLPLRPHDNFRKYSLITTNLTHVNMCHPSMFPIEIGICSCYTFSTGPFQRNPIHDGHNGRYLFKVNFSNVKLTLT